MKKITISTIAICIAILTCSVNIFAAERSVTIDGITYFVNLDDETHSTACVSASDENITEANILSEVVIGNASYTVTKIGEGAFAHREQLQTVTIPTTIKVIENGAFLGTWPNPISLHEGLEEVGYFSLIPCEKNLIIPNSLKRHSYSSFSGFEQVTIKNLSSFCNLEYTEIYGSLLDDMPLYLNNQLLTDITIPSEICKINRFVFQGCSSIERVNTNQVNTISESAFQNCKNLRIVEIGVNSDDVTIERYAFSDCENLEYVELGETVTEIGANAFANLKSLDKVLSHSSIPPTVAESAFENSYPSWTTLYVPVGARAAYKADPVWSQFGEIIEGFEGAGIYDVSSDNANDTVEYYNLNGLRVNNPEHGIFIRKQGSKVKKILL